MKTKKDCEELLHLCAASVGGFFGAYSILNRHENFGSSATTNLIIIISDILGNSLKDAFIRLTAMLIYVSAIILTVLIAHYTSLNTKKLSVFLSSYCAVILCFLPEKMDYIISLYPIFFTTAFQWNSFMGTGKLASSTIFSTNNLRVTVCGYVSYIISKDKKQLETANYYALTLLFFHIGVIYEYIFFRLFGIKSSVAAFPLLAATFAVILIGERRKNR
ncbi:MAG: DUF1275 domain-containing protein [Ruminococcus sp.]|nr:DUF1275 domain-containing protein [Ruminococcus sp.]